MLKANLYPHQVEALNFALARPYSLCGLEMGLGKSLVALAMADKLKSKTLIVCPAFLKKNWLKEIDKFTSGLDFTIISYTSLTKLKNKNFDLVIADEVHYAKNIKAKRTETLHNLLKVNKPKYFIGLTGTPVANRVSEFFSLLQLCYYGGKYPEFSNFNKLYYKFCNTFSYERTIDLGHVTVVRFDGVKNREELKALIAPIYIRRRADQVLDLPDAIDIEIIGDSKNHDKELKEALKLFQADPKDPAYMSLKAANALAKVDTTYKVALDCIEQGNRPIIFTCHVASAKDLAYKLKTDYITGETQADKRQQIIDKFNGGGLTSLVATIQSTSVGFNLTSTNHMIFNDIDFTPANMEQAKARIRRIGQEKKCFYHYVYNSEFDKKLVDMITRKNRDIRKIYD